MLGIRRQCLHSRISIEQVYAERKKREVPKPIVPRATVIIQNMPAMVYPFDAVASMPPTTIMMVVMTMAHLRPR